MRPAIATAIARQVAGFAGSVLATGSRRTGAPAEAAVGDALAGTPHHLHRWGDGGPNPYAGMLAWADAVVVTGDSVSMLSEALATPAPVFIADPGGLGARHHALHDSAYAAGQARPLSAAPDPLHARRRWTRPAASPPRSPRLACCAADRSLGLSRLTARHPGLAVAATADAARLRRSLCQDPRRDAGAPGSLPNFVGTDSEADATGCGGEGSAMALPIRYAVFAGIAVIGVIALAARMPPHAPAGLPAPPSAAARPNAATPPAPGSRRGLHAGPDARRQSGASLRPGADRPRQRLDRPRPRYAA